MSRRVGGHGREHIDLNIFQNIIHIFLFFSDPVPHITTSVPYATSSVPFDITCSLNNATGMINGVQVRLYADDAFALGVTQYNEFCAWNYTNELFKGRFKAHCGSGTMTYRSFLKRYIFTILNPRSIDKTFVCMVKLTAMKKGRELNSNRITLPFNRKCTAVTDINVTLKKKNIKKNPTTTEVCVLFCIVGERFVCFFWCVFSSFQF